MNKILLATALIFPAFSFAAEDVSTTTYDAETSTIEQSAIDPLGRCKVFTNDNIPNTWKRVDSCENYAPAKTGLSPAEVSKRRWQRRLASRTVTTETTDKTPVVRQSRIGSGTLTRGGADRVTSLGIKKRALRMTTDQNLGSTKQFLLDDSRRQTTTATERVRRRNARSGIKSGSATDMTRTGKLSGKFWSTESAQRNKRLDSQETTEGWKKYLDNRQYLSKKGRKDKKEYVYKGPSLRRMYRGSRLEGNIGN